MAKTISGVFTSFNSLTYTNTGNYPYGGPGYPTWTAVLGWSLDGTLASPGDTFTLVMPCVFKFITTQTSVDLTANGVKYATCTFHAGEDFTTFSSMSCVVNNGLSSNIRAFGTVRLPISFNVGGTGSSVNIQDSKCFTAGTNTVTFTDGDHKISTTVNFPKTPQSSSSLVYFARVIPSLDKLSSLVVASQCTAGYASGVLGFSATKDDVTIDCSTIHVGITNGLNSWNMPVSSESFSYTKTCTPNSFIITYENVPAGYRPFIDSYVKKSATATNGFNLNYTNIYNCMDGKKGNDPLIYFWTSYTNSDAGSNGAAVVVTTRTVTDSTTAITTLPFDPTVDKTKTIEVIEPIPTTTITTSYVGISTSLSTKTATIGGTATVVVDVPYHTTTTITSIWTGSATTSSTYTNPTDSIDTVVVQVPLPNPTVTTTQFWSGSVPTTETVTTGPQGTDSVIIKEPHNPTVTTTEFWSESFVTTETITNYPNGTDSVIIREPHNPTVTTTEFWSESFATTETITNNPEGTDSVIIKEPHNPTVTTTEFWSESFATTETITNGPEGTDSVIIKEPHNPTVTTTKFWSESFATTETITTGPLGTDSIVIHDPLEELSSSTAIESSDSNISSSVQDSSSLVEQSFTSADETSSIVELSSSSIGLTSSESSTVSSYDSYSSSTSESSIASSYDSYSSSSIESSTLSSSDRYSSSISDTTSFWDSSSSDLESTLITWSSSIDAQSSHLVQSVSNSISTSQEISSSSSEESSTSATDALVSSDASSILSSDTSSYYPSSTILPSDDFPHTIAGESDSQSISFITSTVEISSDSVSLTSDPASSFDSSSRLNSDSSSLPFTDQRDILTSSSFSTLIKSSESRESSSGTILSEENSDSIPTTFSTRYVSVSLTVGELSALPSLPGKLSHLPSSLSETSIGMTKSANLLPQFFSTSVDSALLYWALGSSSADHQSSATCDVSESSVEGNLSAMAPGMSNSDDGLSEDTRSSSVAGKEEIELTLTNSVGEITLISYSSSSPTTHDHGRVSKSMGAAPLSSLFSVSVHAPLVTGLLDSDTFPSENSNRSRSFKESTDNTISISRESLGNPYSSISSPSDYDVKLFTTSRELVSSESILPFSDVMDANDMPTSGSNLHSMVFSISVLGEKFNANIEKHKNTNGHYSSMVFTYQSAGLEESDQRIAVTNTKFDQNKIDTTIDSNTFVTSLPFATTSNDQIDQAVPIKIPASSTAGFVSDVLKPDYSKSVQAESVQTDSTTYSEMMSSKRNKNSGFGTSSLNLKPTITVVTKSIDTKVNTMKEGGVSKQVSTTVTEQYDTSTYTPASLLVSDNLGSVSKYSLWMMAFYMLFGLF